LRLVAEFGTGHWAKVAARFGHSRTDYQVRKRYAKLSAHGMAPRRSDASSGSDTGVPVVERATEVDIPSGTPAAPTAAATAGVAAAAAAAAAGAPGAASAPAHAGPATRKRTRDAGTSTVDFSSASKAVDVKSG
jgi:hypothetical protein